MIKTAILAQQREREDDVFINKFVKGNPATFQLSYFVSLVGTGETKKIFNVTKI